ncbi:hypothetical protein BBO99_00003530 [Phytophthora kernoviae]|uniref:Homeobox domain-containing protein n=2 Tax=Phytophthora kernoviae TaxID=325452 RepID=A0A3R7JVQ7_9STRA|nr:hypothetical protein G195_003976 [Phytophthora kernoviae 00238/432]KAG2527769.1 hypothetical protein JM16_003188 [Phytophthora kernoviae]KAG2529273.1 hypothetical protein JM18_002869 [Phytophthora kernoviae]RLN10321.1 hypothetical protein BBI17_003641 [Phytophthora kernoviae]RLN81684.1 hypothetical protein BBO99_00003530 [Phytophthora kernoviae]
MTASDAPVGSSFSALRFVRQDDSMDLGMQCCVNEEKPQAPTPQGSVQEHLLMPIIHKLMLMIAQPTKLLAALVVGADEAQRSMTRQCVWAKAVAYQSSELQSLRGAWQRILDAMEVCGPTGLNPTDMMMTKAALYYWRLWHVLQKRRAESISPTFEYKCSDALSQGMIRSGSGLTKRSRLTKKSNEFLIAWFLAHKDNPYPSASERTDIADKTGLAEQQVRNWFANMRKRHWKPNRTNSKKPRCLLDYVLRKPES